MKMRYLKTFESYSEDFYENLQELIYNCEELLYDFSDDGYDVHTKIYAYGMGDIGIRIELRPKKSINIIDKFKNLIRLKNYLNESGYVLDYSKSISFKKHNDNLIGTLISNENEFNSIGNQDNLSGFYLFFRKRKVNESYKNNNEEGTLITMDDIIKCINNNGVIYATIVNNNPDNNPDEGLKPLDIDEDGLISVSTDDGNFTVNLKNVERIEL